MILERTAEYTAHAATDTGQVRNNNEDSFCCEPAAGLFAVIDGVGGQRAGEQAARIFTEIFRARMLRWDQPPDRRLAEALALANNEIVRQSAHFAEYRGMGCVATAAVIEGGRLHFIHAGDTRLYRIRNGGIEKLTHDHSPVGAAEDAGLLSEEEAMAHPRRNQVDREIGLNPLDPDRLQAFAQSGSVALEDDAVYLLVSDGLTDLVPGRAIRWTVEEHADNPAEIPSALIRLANQAGGKDNITVVCVAGDRYRTRASSGWDPPSAALPEGERDDFEVPASFGAGTEEASRLPVWFTLAAAVAGVALLFL